MLKERNGDVMLVVTIVTTDRREPLAFAAGAATSARMTAPDGGPSCGYCPARPPQFLEHLAGIANLSLILSR